MLTDRLDAPLWLCRQVYGGEQAVRAGLMEISRIHHVKAEQNRHKQLVEQGFPEEACALALQLSNNK